MKTNWLYPCLSALAVLGLATVAGAADATIPGIVYIPTEAVTLLPGAPGSAAPCTSNNALHSGLLCGGAGLMAETTIDPHPDAAMLTDEIATALADFDVTVTNLQPRKYVPFMLLMPSETASAATTSFTCTTQGISDCGARHRRRIGRTYAETSDCSMNDPLHAALYAFGRMSGLEGVVDSPDDVMGYESTDDPSLIGPDYSMPVATFVDECRDIAQPWGFDGRGNPQQNNNECTQLDHEGCDAGFQNSVADLLSAYGAAAARPDTDPPVIAITSPEDGAMIEPNTPIQLDATVEDADAYVGARWVVQGEGLVELLMVDTYEYCTNDACIATEGALAGMASFAGWESTTPAKATDSSFAMPEFTSLPPGEYTATFEAADMHGNVAEVVSITFTVLEPASTDDTGDGPEGDGGPDGDNGDGADDFFPEDDDGDGDGDGTGTATGGGDDDSGGCACSTGAGGSGFVALLLGLVGFGLSRRRD